MPACALALRTPAEARHSLLLRNPLLSPRLPISFLGGTPAPDRR